MAAQARVLIFFTSTYPYGIVETFIEDELKYLTKKFDRIIIVTNNMVDNNLRYLPDNVTVLRKEYFAPKVYVLKALTKVFGSMIRSELFNITNNLKLRLNKPVLSILTGSLANALSASAFIEQLVIEEKLAESSLFLYSYWLNDMAAGIAYYKHQHPQVKAFCRAHRWDIYQNEQPHGYAALRPFIFSQLNACYAISTGGAAYLNEITQHRFANKIQVARLGTFTPPETMKADKQRFRLLSCSYMIPRKRIGLIIDALAMLPHLEIEWVHLGGGPVFEDLKAQAAQKIKGKISYDLKGLLNNEQIHAYYQTNKVDLFINLSESEGVPVSIMEANSYSIPALATNTGGVSDIINDENGFLVDVNCTAQKVASLIEQFYNLPATVQQQYHHFAFTTWNNLYNAQKNYTAFADGVINL